MALALAAGAGLAALGWALVLSTAPALAFGAWRLRRGAAAAVVADSSVAAVMREALPLAIHGGLLLLSPRVEFLVLSLLRGDRETGLFLAALRVFEFLNVMPAAVVAGAMPGLTREALRGQGSVRQRTAWTLAFLALPAAVRPRGRSTGGRAAAARRRLRRRGVRGHAGAAAALVRSRCRLSS